MTIIEGSLFSISLLGAMMIKITPRIFISNGLVKTGLTDIANFFGIIYEELLEIIKKMPAFFGIKDEDDFNFCKVDVAQFNEIAGVLKVDIGLKDFYLKAFEETQKSLVLSY